MGLAGIVLSALAMSVGWGFRGDYGHEAGAMVPGALQRTRNRNAVSGPPGGPGAVLGRPKRTHPAVERQGAVEP